MPPALMDLAWTLARPSTLLLVALALAFAAAVRGASRAAAAWLGGVLAFALLLAAVPLGEIALRPLEARFPIPTALPADAAGIVVLGGATEEGPWLAWGEPTVGPAAERMEAAAALALALPEARIVFTGGGRGRVPEAVVARAWFARFGIEPPRLLLEPEARDTAENAALALELAAPAPGETWILVTSAAHMPRSVGLFRAAGWPEPLAWPVDHRSGGALPGRGHPLPRLAALDDAAREWLALVAYRALGRTPELLPGPRR